MLKPHEWTTVIVGSWNPAIFTPKGIAEILFQKPAGEPIEVMVPLDGLGPSRIIIDELIISPEPGRIVIGSKKPTWDMLDKTRAVAIRAIEELPRTPLIAAGFNVRYHLESPSEEFFHLIDTKLDNSISNAALRIMSREVHRSLEFNGGRLNLHIDGIDSIKFALLMNFERRSSKQKDLVEWLQVNIADVENIVKKILYNVLDIKE